MAVFLGTVIIAYGILFVYGVISYVFNSYGLYKISKREEKNCSFLAWIPYFNKITEGKIAFGSSIQGVIMAFLAIFAMCAMGISIFTQLENAQLMFSLVITSFIFSLICKAYDLVAHYKIYNKYSKSAVIMTLFDVITLGILGPIFIFAIKDNELKIKEK